MKLRPIIKLNSIFIISMDNRPLIVLKLMLKYVTAKKFGNSDTFVNQFYQIVFEQIAENVGILVLDDVLDD
jgi:hypothetical protein